MATRLDIELLYPEEYIIEEDLLGMGDSNAHTLLINYLRAVLEWFYRWQQGVVLSDINLYHWAIENRQHYIVPDVLLVKVAMSFEEQSKLISWSAEEHAPEVVFEISSQSTWKHDVSPERKWKPSIYGRIGVKEYYAYDPHTPAVWTGSLGVRLRGWHYNEAGEAIELVPDEAGRLWSEELASYLVPDGSMLRLTDREGNRRLTKAEALDIARVAAEVRASLEAKARRQEAKARRAEANARRQEATARHEAEVLAAAEAEARVAAELRAAQAEQQNAELQRQLDELRRRNDPQ